MLCLAHESDARRRMISKSFHHQLKVSERQAVTGPPESMREHVVAASKAMRNGLWKQAHNFIINEKMNAKVLNFDFVSIWSYINNALFPHRCGICSTKLTECVRCWFARFKKNPYEHTSSLTHQFTTLYRWLHYPKCLILNNRPFMPSFQKWSWTKNLWWVSLKYVCINIHLNPNFIFRLRWMNPHKVW